MKNTKRNSRDTQNQSPDQRRAAALRALSTKALKTVAGGEGTYPPPPSSDPIC